MKIPILTTLAFAALCGAALAPLGVAQAQSKPAPPSIDGLWMGRLDVGAIKLRIVIKIAKSGDGLTAQMQSPDQSPTWIPVSSISLAGSTLHIALKSLGIDYEGKLAPDLTSIDGTFTQTGGSLATNGALSLTAGGGIERCGVFGVGIDRLVLQRGQLGEVYEICRSR